MTPQPPMIPLAECEDRRLYEIYSRNLTHGVFRAATGGFIGIRYKLGSRYLFEEYHWERDPRLGTVRPEQALPVVLPSDIILAEFMPSSVDPSSHHGTWCTEHDREAEYREDVPGAQPRRGKWFHLDDGTVLGEDDSPSAKMNVPLFEFIEQHIPHDH